MLKIIVKGSARCAHIAKISMVSKTSKMLSEEHKYILKVISALENEQGKLKAGNINMGFLEETLDFIRNYADKLHHAKEEDILFKEFDRLASKGKTHCNPTQQMLYEHNLGRTFVKNIVRGMNENNPRMIMENAQGYCQLLREHISKEDDILYPMADEAMNQNMLDKIYKKFLQIDKKRMIEKNKYEKFAKLSEKRE